MQEWNRKTTLDTTRRHGVEAEIVHAVHRGAGKQILLFRMIVDLFWYGRGIPCLACDCERDDKLPQGAVCITSD